MPGRGKKRPKAPIEGSTLLRSSMVKGGEKEKKEGKRKDITSFYQASPLDRKEGGEDLPSPLPSEQKESSSLSSSGKSGRRRKWLFI